MHTTARFMRSTMQSLLVKSIYDLCDSALAVPLTRGALSAPTLTAESTVPSTGMPHFVNDTHGVVFAAHVTKPTLRGDWQTTHKVHTIPLFDDDTAILPALEFE